MKEESTKVWVSEVKEITVKNKVKIARIEKGKLTQGDLAKRVGVTRQTMNLIEAQKYNPTIRVCLLISKQLDCPVDELFWIEEE
ncbi:helix-turn-helix transcriptional regulator [Neobacillus muris]|uniref:helix-turn-helix transcriptional regulator n=1 Tax=Neobacillus muris TaxID=2941334 RepID=UPI002041BE69|nr:helix-turn-helix transcriptional regulator [Neobacillus muris]